MTHKQFLVVKRKAIAAMVKRQSNASKIWFEEMRAAEIDCLRAIEHAHVRVATNVN